MEEGRSAFTIPIHKPTGERFLGRPRYGWEDNIRMNLKEIGVNMRNWVDSTEDRDNWRAHVHAVLKLWVPLVLELVN